MKYAFYPSILTLLWSAAVSALAGSPPSLIGSHEDWKAYSFMDGNEKVCFISSQPQKQEGKFRKRGEVFFFVTRWPDKNGQDAISISSGYPFKPESEVALRIGDMKFDLFTQGEMAWTRNPAADDSIIRDIQKGASMTVRGVSRRDTETTDTYSLKGVTDAYQSIMKECSKKS